MSDEKKSPFTVMGALYVLGGTLTISSIVGLFVLPDNPLFKIMLISVVAMAAAVGVYQLVLMLKDKSKSGPFAKLLTRSAAGGAVDPATKARMDDLRRKFEEGVAVYKSAGKDLYTLPWFLLVGPSGSGKTEALRRSNVGFPQGLQDCLQGAGGTLNMHWWFTNAAVVLDTAGRLFMQEDDREWKEFMRLLKDSRPNCPINGLLLVISSENLLMDSAEKIESTAGAIARKLDEMQRILDVRFPVNVIVTKCDKIIGFRDFFETLNDPILQHQILGWANPSPLDEAFKPDLVEKHLDSVRQKLVKRRMGLIQNPVHTEDASARRIDQVDEMFELPDNFMRIAPRLRLYLEKIFVAGEWSPKPLFLRGIYFTSSMREGAALDMSLAQALGVEVQSLPGSRDWDRDKAYFLKDLFLERVFKERGLVTRATNVSKQIKGQRMTVIAVTSVMLLLAVGAGLWSYFSYKGSLGTPASFWKQVPALYAKAPGDGAPLPLISVAGGEPKYLGQTEVKDADSDELNTPIELLSKTADHVTTIEIPPMARPIAALSGVSGGFGEEQADAHRAVVEVNVIRPVVEAARKKLDNEKSWGPLAVGALGELVRLQTYALGGVPSDEQWKLANGGDKPAKGSPAAREVIDVDALYLYVLEGSDAESKKYQSDSAAINAAVKVAYTPALWAKHPPERAWAVHPSSGWAQGRIDAMALHKIGFHAEPDSDFGRFQSLLQKLGEFGDKEQAIKATKYIKARGAGADSWPRSIEDYDDFKKEWDPKWQDLAKSFAEISPLVTALGTNLDDPYQLLKVEGDKLAEETVQALTKLLDQLPAAPTEDAKAKKPAAVAAGDDELAEMRTALLDKKKQFDAALEEDQKTMTDRLASVSPLLVVGSVTNQGIAAKLKACEARFKAYEAANEFLGSSAAPLDQKELPSLADADSAVNERVKAATDKVRGCEGWAADKSSLDKLRCSDEKIVGALNTARDESVGASIKAVELAKSRLAHEHLKDYLRLSPKGSNLALAKELVQKIAASPAAKFKLYDQPNLPLSGFKAAEPFNPEYHPWAAKKWLTDWTLLDERLGAKTPAAPDAPADSARSTVLAGAELLNSENYLQARGAIAAYVNDYARYWKLQVLDEGMPNNLPSDWASVSGSLNFSHNTVNGGLTSLQDMILGAEDSPKDYVSVLGAVPEAVATPEFRQMKADLAQAFSPLRSQDFSTNSREMLNAWKILAKGGGGAATAAGTLLESMVDGNSGCQTYFAVPSGGETNPGYWRAFAERCAMALRQANQGAVGAAKQFLSQRGSSPLCQASGAGGLRGETVTKTDLPAIRGYADVLSHASGGAGAGASGGSKYNFKCAGSKIEEHLLAMSGKDQVDDPKTPALAARVLKICDILNRDDLEIVFSGPPQGSDVAWSRAFYLELRRDGQPLKSIGIADTDTLSIPLKGGGAKYELFFYQQGNNNSKLEVASAPLNQAWPLLHEMLTSGKMKEVTGTDGKPWIQFDTSFGGDLFRLRVQVKYDKDKLLNVADWPTSSEWQWK